jgi:GT2 family glycosyltransferase
LLFLNPDCVLEPTTISHLIAALDERGDSAMVGGLLLNPDGTEQQGGRRAVPTPWRSFVRAFGLYRFSNRWPRLFFNFNLHEQPLPDHRIEVEAISGACMLVRCESAALPRHLQ